MVDDGGGADATTSSSSSKLDVTPAHVLFVGGCSVATGLLLSLGWSYRSSTKALAKEGIDPRVRSRVLPVAVGALVASTLVTSMVGVGGWYLLREYDVLSKERAQVPTISEAASIVSGGVHGFWKDAMSTRQPKSDS